MTYKGFPCGSVSKESVCDAGDLGLIPGLRRSPGGGHGNPLQYSCLGNPHGQRSLAGYSLWCLKELDTTERLSTMTYDVEHIFIYLSALCISSLVRSLFKVCVCVCTLSHSVVSNSFWPHGLVTHQAPLSMEFPREEYWSGLSFSMPGDPPDPGIEWPLLSLLHWQANSLPLGRPGKPHLFK